MNTGSERRLEMTDLENPALRIARTARIMFMTRMVAQVSRRRDPVIPLSSGNL